MNTNNPKWTKLVKRISGLVTAVMLLLSMSATASARILFEDDDFFNVDSEGIILDFNNDIGSTNADITLQFGNDTTDASIDYNGSTGDITLSTPGGDFDFSDDNLTTTGGMLMQGSSEFHIREVAGNPNTVAACTTLDEIVLDTVANTMYVCTAVGAAGAATWVNAASASGTDLQGAYDADASGAHEIVLATGDGEAVEIRADANGDDLLQLQNSAAGNLINFQDLSGTTIDIDSLIVDWDATGAFNLDATTTVAIGAGTDVTVTAGDDIIFDDAQLAGIVQMSDVASDFAATFSTDGIIDNLNSFTSTANGDGASNVGIEDASAWFTGAEIEAALNEIETLFGSTTSSTFNFTEDNVLADNDPVYTALNKLDLKWGDLASTATGEGASLVGIEDVGGYITGTTVEGAIQELGASLFGNNYEDLTFYPEYPDSVIHADGTNNKGTLESLYDTGEVSGYYNWTVQNGTTQDIDIRFAFPMPTDFSATGDFTFRYRTGTVTEADNDVEVRLYNVTDAAECANDLTNGTAGTWATGTITAASINTGCTGGTVLDAGDIVEVQIKLYDNTGAADYSDVGRLIWNYTK